MGPNMGLVMDVDPFLMPFTDDIAASKSSPPNPTPSSDTRPRKKKARTLRETDWEPYKDRVIQLHLVDRRPLPEVKMLIEQEFGFIAEIRQYRSRLTQWKLDKNIKPEEMKVIVRHRQQRGLIETDKGSLKFRVRGREVEPQKIERWMKRHDVIESMIYAPSPVASTPSAVSYATMSEIGSPSAYSMLSPGGVQDVDMNIDVDIDTDTDIDTDSSPNTPRLYSPEPQPMLSVAKVDKEHIYVQWQGHLTEYRTDRNTLDLSLLIDQVLESLARPLPSNFHECAATIVNGCLLQRYNIDYLTSHRLDLLFYIRLPPKLFVIETVDVRLLIIDNHNVGNIYGRLGFNFVPDWQGGQQCQVAWPYLPELPKSIMGLRLTRVLWGTLRLFTWPKDDEDVDRRLLFDSAFGWLEPAKPKNNYSSPS